MAILVAALIDQGKLLSDKRGDGSIADADWLVWVNRAVESLWRVLTSIDPEAYFTEVSFTLAGGSSGDEYDFAAANPAFRGLHGLDYAPDTTDRRTVPRAPFAERNAARIGWWTPAPLATDRRFDLRGRKIVITPYENAAGNYRAYYRGAPYLFTGTSDVTALDWQLEPYAEDIEYLISRKALTQEETAAADWDRRIAEIRAEMQAAHDRTPGEPARIADVEGDEEPWWA